MMALHLSSFSIFSASFLPPTPPFHSLPKSLSYSRRIIKRRPSSTKSITQHPPAPFKCFSKRQPGEEGKVEQAQDEEQVFQFERLYSNLNQVTLKREPGRRRHTCNSRSDSRIRISSLSSDLHPLLDVYGFDWITHC